MRRAARWAALASDGTNVMLHDLDKELERRKHRFARYADDFLVFVRSKTAAQRVLRSISRFIKGRLRLRINRSKSKAAPLGACSFLGFELRHGRLRWTNASAASGCATACTLAAPRRAW